MKRFLKDESGLSAIEYGLIAGLVGVAMITALQLLAPNLGAQFNGIAEKINQTITLLGL